MTTNTRSGSVCEATVSTGLAEVCDAARALASAARFDEALALLDSATPPPEAPGAVALALAAAEVATRRDYVRGGDVATARCRALTTLVGLEPATQWDVDLLLLRRAYNLQLVDGDGSPWFGPQGRDLAEISRMQQEARRLFDVAPDDGRRGWAAMVLGWISDNLLADRDSAPPHYEDALVNGRATGDDLLVFEAQRHLGDHDHDRHDLAAALGRWQESTTAAARAGQVAGVLAQQLLLAVLARDAGDEAAATALGEEVARWSDAIGAINVGAQARSFLSGVDPTMPPVDE